MGWLGNTGLFISLVPGLKSAVVVFRTRRDQTLTSSPLVIVAYRDLEDLLTLPRDEHLKLDRTTMIPPAIVHHMRTILWETVNRVLEGEDT